MKLFETYIYPKIYDAVTNGVNSTSVVFDECMKPALFNENNMNQLCNFINTQITVGYGKTTCIMTKSKYIGNRYTILIQWTK